MLLERRNDVETAWTIQRAVRIEQQEGAVKAWTYLAVRGISTNAICRVLGLHGGVPLRRAFECHAMDDL
ncbi:hypothetical protein GJV26_18715 [Massilia dura]|uniref:Uncharacterized protein n=1 Tax=Pseudoduganella dura TaxID=321982 RepID=A0A6I3XC20_9BURK|nr:hypothetical protein [Pseudoduganella dura]MUI14474.1 hypothetical protein [Pseudoduganella dura]GGY14028.1 hypothetical protein GCM10007386_50300 [Pseudoduganella dura]